MARLLVVFLLLSTVAVAQHCSYYDSSDGTAPIELGPNSTNHNKAATFHSLLAGALNNCTYSDTGVAGEICITQEVIQPEGTKYDSGLGTTFEPFGHKLDADYPPASVRNQGATTATGRAEFAVQGCYLPDCPGGVTFSYPPFTVSGSHVIFSEQSPITDFCAQHQNVAPKGCFGQCGTPLMTDLSEAFGIHTQGNDLDHLTDRKYGYTMKFNRKPGQDWATVKPQAIGWTTPGSYMAVLVRPDANGEYNVKTSDNVFGNYSMCANGKLCSNGFEALRYYCDDALNSGNGDGVCDAKDLQFKDLRWQVGRTKLLTMKEAHVKAIHFDATEMHGKWRRRDQFGNTFAIRGSMEIDNALRVQWVWDVIPVQEGVK